MHRRRRHLSRLSFALLAYFAGTLTSAVTAVFGPVSWQVVVPTLIAAAVVHSAYRADRSTARLARDLVADARGVRVMDAERHSRTRRATAVDQ